MNKYRVIASNGFSHEILADGYHVRTRFLDFFTTDDENPDSVRLKNKHLVASFWEPTSIILTHRDADGEA